MITLPTYVPSLGALPTDQGTLFRVWSSQATCVSVVVYAETHSTTHALTALGNGMFAELVCGIRPGARYRFEVDGQVLPDPYARALPDGVDGPAAVWAPAYAFQSAAPSLTPDELVIYEVHVGTFTPEGTFAAVQAKLPELANLGVTCVELMPLSSFPGRWGWGYDGVAPFSPYAGYGTPEDLMALIDEAHRLGMVVLLDLVLNHFGPDGNYLGTYSPEYVTSRHQTPWGDALNYDEPYMRRLALDCAEHWLRIYRVDGLRLDATHEIFDDQPTHILSELAAHVRNLSAELGTRHFLFCEDDRNAPELVTETGMDGLWADDFHHQLRVVLTGEQDGYYRAYTPELSELARCLNRGWLYEGQAWPLEERRPRGAPADGLPASSFVYCTQNHDQIGNRAHGDRLDVTAGSDAFLAASALLLFLPMTPLLFQGQEWMASSPFHYFSDHAGDLGAQITAGRRDEFSQFEAFLEGSSGEGVPDPQAEGTFRASVLNWSERQKGEHARTLALYRRLLALRRHDRVLGSSERRTLRAGSCGSVLWVRRGMDQDSRLLLVNVSDAPVEFRELPSSGVYWLLRTNDTHPGTCLPARSAWLLALSCAWTPEISHHPRRPHHAGADRVRL
ncbi:malto-oligosyltrehalose trehalohydrolase [Deinococcus sp. KSM4-11]|uniref:malto-oligosyltrehalose trehalohydrolase n=1 Tax=Deinococcus sp. KSM4-11 TaxID=2568654 RepID=UPI0010A437F6|nr:malto-oligosyltrehalose trehalohydrolase [Deinococcus sp. KSM4-11]THF84392.1 malto-oligosyltrehalose trehalohydrolase [Deinococcus sp. KSM4-11]